MNSDDPYRAPEAPLAQSERSETISPKAMELLAGSRWGMRAVAIALMANAAGTLAGAFTLEQLYGTDLQLPVIIILLLIALILFVPGLRLLQSAAAITRAAQSGEESEINLALHRHRQFWLLLGCSFLFITVLLYLAFSFIRLPH